MNQNETKKLSDLRVGDTAVLVYRLRYGKQKLTPVTVTKVLKSGKIKTRTPSATADRTWYPDGGEYGNKYGSENIRTLNDGETAETIMADRAAAAEQAKTEAEAKNVEHKAEIAKWWAETGKQMWADAIEVPGGFMGKKVYIIRFTRHNESYMPFVTIETKINDWSNKAVIEAQVGGLNGRTWEGIKGTNTSVSAYSSNTREGETLEDVLYSICN